MAINSTIYKLKLEISDLGRHYYQTHDLTIACHPSETKQRLMVRVLAFALFANDRLSFTRGLCADDEPELWDKSLSDEINLWIYLGQVDEKQIKKAIGRSKQVVIFTYAGQKSSSWWEQNKPKLSKLSHLTILHINPESVAAMQTLVSRNMTIHCTIQEGVIWLADDKQSLSIEPETWLSN